MKIQTKHSEVLFGESCWEALNDWVTKNTYSKVFVLTDDNTQTHCLSYFEGKVGFDFIPLNMPAGEENKHIHSCVALWEDLSTLDADRKSLLINLGGGVVTDLGGFVACTFKLAHAIFSLPLGLPKPSAQ
jgi:3-dehydroquinate synthase